MKHYSGIDYEHFLDDVRDMYPFGIDEAVLTELIANALDARTTLLDIRIDPELRTFEITDNGSGMDAREFEAYHNFSMSFKRKGQGIGFAGLGAKLALKISERIITETRKEPKGKKGKLKQAFWGASEWKFERKRKTVHPVWYDIDERLLPHHGTRVKIHLHRPTSHLLNPDDVRRVILTHYLPILAVSDFYESLRLYHRITVLMNGELLQAPQSGDPATANIKQMILHRGRSRKPFALARFELHVVALPESMQGIGVSTFGKIIKREYFKQFFQGMERVTGLIEVPELVDSLTTSKCDFRKEGTAGKKYYRFTKIAQEEFRMWLENVQLVERKELSPDRDAQRLQRLVTQIVSEIPDLQQFYGFRSVQPSLVKDPDGGLTGTRPEPALMPEENLPEADEERFVREALERAAREGATLEEGDTLGAAKRPRNMRFGPAIHSLSAPERTDMSWMEGETVFINTAHPAYRKSVEKKVVEYHNLFAIALAMLREVPTAQEKLELLEKFISEWGKL